MGVKMKGKLNKTKGSFLRHCPFHYWGIRGIFQLTSEFVCTNAYLAKNHNKRKMKNTALKNS